MAPQHSCPGLGEITKAGQRKVLESSLCLTLVFLSRALRLGVLPKSALVFSCSTEQVTSFVAGRILVPGTGPLQNSLLLNVGRIVNMTEGHSHEEVTDSLTWSSPKGRLSWMGLTKSGELLKGIRPF